MRILTFILHLLSKLRLLLYRYKILKTHSFDVPIISVGNIEHGGTGKTPMIAWLIKELQLKNKKICVVTRGYGRNNSETIVINHDKQYIVDEIGDEPYALLKEFPNMPMVISNNKIEAINVIINNQKPDIILLDDGFQSIYIKRDLDIVMVNQKKINPIQTREPLSQLKRADLVICKPDLYDNTDSFLEINSVNNMWKIYCEKNNIPYIHTSTAFSVWDKSNMIDTTSLGPVIAVCGIANPKSFISALKFEKITVKKNIIYKDHYNYSDDDLEHIYRIMKNLDCKSVITTTKDYYKLMALNNSDVKIIKLKMEFHFLDTMNMPSKSSASRKHIITNLLDQAISRVS